MAKKWYNYFVSVEGEGAPGEPAAQGGDAAKAIAEIAASIQPPAAQVERMEQKMAAQAAAAPPAARPGAGAGAAAGKPLEFSEIYAAAEIAAPAHGYTIMKVADMLHNPHIKDLPGEVKRSSVMVALEAAGVKIEDIIQDAVRRDRALDAFERIQQKAVDDFDGAKTEESRKLQAELDKMTADYKARMQANADAVAQRRESFAAWRVQKQIEEQKIADSVSYFVTENPITTTARPSTASAPAAAPPKPGAGD